MSSLVTAVLKTVICIPMSKGRSLAAEKLKGGDVANIKLRQLIIKDMEDIKSKLNGMLVKDLVASITFFNEGVVYLENVLVREKDGGRDAERKEVTTEVDGATKEIKVKEDSVVSLAKEMKNLLVVDLNKEERKAIEDAKDRFKNARQKAIEAFSNPALSTSDRLLAMVIRIMATVFEQVDNPASAMGSLRYCLEELHSLPAVPENFSVTLNKGLKSKLFQDRRNEIISAVLQMNRIIYDLTHEFVEDGSKSKQLLIWPYIEVEGEKIDLLRDPRMAERFREISMEQYCVQPWSFGQRGEKEELLESIASITINTKGQFIVGDKSTVKVFDRQGNFLYSFSPPKCNDYINCVAVDQADNTYILNKDNRLHHTVYVFDAQAKLDHSFRVKTGMPQCSLMVDCSSGNILLWESDTMETSPSETFDHALPVMVFSNRGDRLRTISVSCNTTFNYLCTTGKGRLFVLDWHDCILHSISINDGSDREEKKIQLAGKTLPTAMKFHQPSEHFFILSSGSRYGHSLNVSIYNKDFKCVCTIPLNVSSISGFAVNNDGHIIVGIESQGKPLLSVV